MFILWFFENFKQNRVVANKNRLRPHVYRINKERDNARGLQGLQGEGQGVGVDTRI